MITKVFKGLISLMMQSSGSSSSKGIIEIKDAYGNTGYLANKFEFPYFIYDTVAFTGSRGIFVGSGSTPASENDYNLENRITTGLTSSAVTVNVDTDNDGNPFKSFTFTLTNSTANDIIIKELGYAQNVHASASRGASSSTAGCLLDRTVLTTPITIPANGSNTLKYTIKSILPSS